MTMDPKLITVLLTDRAPKTLDPDKWRILVQTPEVGAPAQYLAVRVCSARAVVYGHKGTGANALGQGGLDGAGHYAGTMLTLDIGDSGVTGYDPVAKAIFQVGNELGFDKKMLWELVQKLPAREL